MTAAGIIAVVGALTIGGFYFFQYVLHLPPCPLCLEQRQPYYFCVPLAALLFIGANHGASNKVMIARLCRDRRLHALGLRARRLSRRRRMEVVAGADRLLRADR